MKLLLFAYNFPHKKTQDFLFRLLINDRKPELVVASEPVKLNLPESILRVKPNHIDLIHPEEICRKFSIDYIVKNHNDLEIVDLVKERNIDIGLIAGARILKKDIINTIKGGIINFHPAIIPEIRGLDTLKWSIYYDIPLGVTAHFIDSKVDAGRIIEKRKVPVFQDDSFIDLSLRIYETQLNMLPDVLQFVEGKKLEDFPLADLSLGRHNSPMSRDTEIKVRDKFEKYKQKFSNKN